VLIVLVVFYAGILLFMMSGPSIDDVDDLRKIARWVLILAVVASGMLIFLGSKMFSLGPADEPLEAAISLPATEPAMEEEEVLLEEYLGLRDEEAREEAQESAEEVEITGPPGAAEQAEQAALCGRCGAQLVEGSQYCHHCGALVA
jgi:hypothetical protein